MARDGIDGMVIPPHDEDGWIEALRMFSRSAELRDHYGESARIRAGEFTWEKVAARRAEAMLNRLGKPVSAPD